jgi:cyclomaltodextrinase / maltogenic alpha-amylase / neopullulanase
MTVPEWVKDAIFYQIFPDRFANGDPSNDPANVVPWNAPPTRRGFQGGDLKGITNRIDYLVDLGINALYLNPIFLAASTHRYDTVDYLRIDPKLGNLEDFHHLIDTAHQNGIRVILDGVFNHCSRGFFAFNDILENGPDSPYLNWFHIHRFPLRAYEPGHARNYTAWWGIKSLPKLNTSCLPVRKYLLEAARYWIDQGADGWRLDVPNEIDDDGFWAEFRDTVRSANPEAYTLGEIWETLPRWVGENHFDGLMNYPVRTAVLQFLTQTISAGQFGDALAKPLSSYPSENIPAMYNLLGSHDTERVLTHLGGDERKLKLAFQFLFAFPGIPSIYYGDEIGLKGGGDPDCRGAFPWDPSGWNHSMYQWCKQLVHLRKSTPALKYGSYQQLNGIDNPRCFTFLRSHENEAVITALNASDEMQEFSIPLNGTLLSNRAILYNLLNGLEAVVQSSQVRISVQPWQGIYLA